MRSLTRTLLEAAGSGFAGALTVTALNEVMRRKRLDAPQLQITGKRAVRKTSKMLGFSRPSSETQYRAAIAGGLLDATLLYSLVRIGRYPRPVMRGVMLGGLAGLSALYLPELAGLGRAPVRLTSNRKRLTFGYYLAGGLVAGLVGRGFAEMRAMTPHPIKSTRRRWQKGPEIGSTFVRQTEEARF